MPKKQRKSREEKIVENYFPVDEGDLKYTTEKKEKTPVLDTKTAIEKIYKKPEKKNLEKVEQITRKRPKRKYTRKKSEKISKIKKYQTPKISLKKNGYELIITEKPQAALKIANALGKAVQKNINKIPYYEVERNGKKILVACAVGHLFTLKQNKTGAEIPVFDISWIPNFLARKKDFTKKYLDTILKLVKNAGSITIATDYDVEGEVIGMNVMRFVCGQSDASRMKFSTLTKEELNKSYESKSKNIAWGQAIAGETRHYLDWFYGINLSRALMNAIKTTGGFKIMSIGRVQGPALDLIVKKEKQIQEFKSKPYWQIFITADDGKNKLELKYEKDIFKKEDLEKFKELKGKTGKAETKKTEKKLPPNPPFNLTALQTEAYRLYSITPSRTLQIAQSLYLAGLISYPRTSSQKLPDSIGYKKILEKLAEKYKAEKLIIHKKPIEGKKTDPAHPSIYPTGNLQILSKDDEKIYSLIVKRFLALFCEDAIIANKNIKVEVEKLNFKTRGASILKKSWTEIYPTNLKENQIPDLKGEVQIIDSRTEQKETQPPKRYSPASIISELEKRNLGTKATRSSILETLYDRNYIKDTSIKASPLGLSLINTLEKHSPIIIDEKLTRHFEREMENIQQIKKDHKSKQEKIINEAKETIKKIINQFKTNENKIGKELSQATTELRELEKEENKLNQCPVCKKGNLTIKYSRKTKRHFVACDAYPECKTTYSLPPNGAIKKTEKICEECGFPMLMRLSKGKRPWTFCFNPKCPTNKSWAKKN